MRAKNHCKPWTQAEERRLEQLSQQNVPVHAIALELERSVTAIRNKAKSLDVLLPLYTHRTRTATLDTRTMTASLTTGT
jgi:hypothetical protein